MVSFYREQLKLLNAHFTLIEHEDAIVATVFKVTVPSGEEFILKICSRVGDYLREVYFLNYFSDKLPVPRIIQLVEPKEGVHGAILMECLSGQLLKIADFNEKLLYEVGSSLARIHLERTKGYGDLIEPEHLSQDPRIPFTLKFDEGLEECASHLPVSMLKKCRQYFEEYLDLLKSSDGPCMIHRDFRPGNVFVREGRLQGIIDWSSARAGFAEEDFCPLETGEWSNHPKFHSAFLSGYSSLRKLPDYQRIMPLLRLSRSVATIGFTVKTGTWETKNNELYRRHRQFLESLVGWR